MTESKSAKSVLITGGSNGIGSAIVTKLASNNYKIVNADVETPKNGKGYFKNCDVTKKEDIDDLFQWTKKTIGNPEVLIINAGKGIFEKLAEGDPEKWKSILDLNILGALRCIRAFVPAMIESKNGHVIVISSVAAFQPHANGGIYSASKTALEIIAETLRLETFPHIKVSIIAPGVTDTSFFSHEISRETTVEELGLGAISPKDIAEDVWYILNKPSRTSIQKIVTRPSKQIF